MKIDLDRILRDRIGGWKGRLVPRALTRMLEGVVRQERLNELLEYCHPAEGADFAARLYKALRIRINVQGWENVPKEGRFVFASNHPLGGLDGIGLINVLGHIYGDHQLRFIVNDMLLAVEPLRCVFLPVNKYGRQAREAARAIREAYESDMQIALFPAGLVSRLDDKGRIRDLEWQKSFVQKAAETGRDIIPVRFEGLNSMRFYKTARWRKRLGLKVNLEQTMLPGELCEAHDKTFTVTFMPAVTNAELLRRMEEGETAAQIAAGLRLLSNPE